MSSINQDQQESLFQTPNPTELKEKAKENPIPPIEERDRGLEGDINEEHDSVESYFEDEQTRALSSSPIINANLSAG